jgi:hypothetical protein
MGVCHGQPRTGVSITVDRGHVDRARFSNPESESTNPESENTPEGFSFLNPKMFTMEEIRLLKLDEHRLETIVRENLLLCLIFFVPLCCYLQQHQGSALVLLAAMARPIQIAKPRQTLKIALQSGPFRVRHAGRA